MRKDGLVGKVYQRKCDQCHIDYIGLGEMFCSRKCRDDSRKGKPAANKGVPMSEAQKVKLSIARKGKTGYHHTPETRRKISESHKGSKNPFWRGGVSEENHRLRNSVEYKLWREAVFKRDDWTCQICGQRGKRIEADHIKSWKHNIHARFDISNGRTLCKKCHEKTDSYGWKGR